MKQCQIARFFCWFFLFVSKTGLFFQLVTRDIFWHYFDMICSFEAPQWTWITIFKFMRSRKICRHFLYLRISMPADTWSTLNIHSKMFIVIAAKEQKRSVISSEKLPFWGLAQLPVSSRLGSHLTQESSVCCSMWRISCMLSENMKTSLLLQITKKKKSSDGHLMKALLPCPDTSRTQTWMRWCLS